LYTCSLAEHGKLEEVFGFLATTKNCIIILVVLSFFSYKIQNTAAGTGKKMNSNQDTILQNGSKSSNIPS